MNAEIIAVGTEILLGDIVNTNAQFIAAGLSSVGIDVFYQTVVGDNPQRLTDCLALAKSRADIIITTGGLGPTYDDLTKETIAASFGRKMVMHEECLKQMEEFFAGLGRTMTENNKKQAIMPEDSIILENAHGTAPGCIIEGKDGKIAIMMPGPPREMKPMFTNQVLPYLHKLSGEMIVSKTLRIMGMGESMVETKLRDMMEKLTNPTVAPYAKTAECTVRVTAKAKTEEEAVKMIDPVIDQIKEILGDVVYGVDIPSLEYCVVEALKKAGKTVAVAESCTGGLLAKRITDIPGASEVFHFGAVTYSDVAKMEMLGVRADTLADFTAVSAPAAVEMARGIYKNSDADFGLSVTGIAGPGGGTEEKPCGLCYIALYDGEKTWLKRVIFHRDRDYVRNSAAQQALDMVRRRLINEK